MHTSEYDYLFKLLLIGDSGVGKVRAAFVLRVGGIMADVSCFFPIPISIAIHPVLLAPTIRR